MSTAARLFFLTLISCSQPLPPGRQADLSVASQPDSEAPDLGPSCQSECPTENATRCTSGGQEQTCLMKNGCLVWDTASDCAPGSLCCNDTCVTIDENNCFGCGTVCTGATPVCSSTLERCACTATACAPSRHDCDANLGVCVACIDPPIPESRSDIYVDGAAVISGTGSLGCPYGSIGQGLLEAGASSAPVRTVHLAAGTYSAENFPLTVRSGVSLAGAGASATIIQGTGALDHSLAGGALNVSTFATIVLGDEAGSTNLRDLTVRMPSAAPAANHYGVLCDRGNTPQTITNPPATMPAPNATLSGVTVGPGFDYGIAVTNTTIPSPSACNLRLEKSSVSGNFNGIWVVGCGTGGPGGIVSAQIDGNQLTNNGKPSNDGYGVVVWDCSSPVAVSNNTFDGDNGGLALAQHPRLDSGIPVPGFITIENNTFKNLTNVGIVMGAAVILERLTSNSFTNISTSIVGYPGIAVVLDGSGGGANNYRPQIKKARKNSFIGNDLGVVFRGSTPIAPDPDGYDTDFGSDADPGNNIFRCNSTPSGSSLIGYDVLVQTTSVNGGGLGFAGNQWDSAGPRVTAAVSAANGYEVLESGASPVPPINLDNSTASTAMCPAGRTP